jgi:uncharacterized protein
LRTRREAAAAGIQNRSWLQAYERIFTRKDAALVPVEDGVCGGCHMTLPPSVVHQARRRNAAVACVYCGRLLY